MRTASGTREPGCFARIVPSAHLGSDRGHAEAKETDGLLSGDDVAAILHDARREIDYYRELGVLEPVVPLWRAGRSTSSSGPPSTRSCSPGCSQRSATTGFREPHLAGARGGVLAKAIAATSGKKVGPHRSARLVRLIPNRRVMG